MGTTSGTRLPTRPRELSPAWSPFKATYPLFRVTQPRGRMVAIMDIFTTMLTAQAPTKSGLKPGEKRAAGRRLKRGDFD